MLIPPIYTQREFSWLVIRSAIQPTVLKMTVLILLLWLWRSSVKSERIDLIMTIGYISFWLSNTACITNCWFIALKRQVRGLTTSILSIHLKIFFARAPRLNEGKTLNLGSNTKYFFILLFSIFRVGPGFGVM